MRLSSSVAIICLLTALAPPAVKATVSATGKSVVVDCDKGESINKALTTSAEVLVVEVRGLCKENVEINREDVTLRGRDPQTDGVRGIDTEDPRDAAVALRAGRAVRIENLLLTGEAENGLRVDSGTRYPATVENCWIVANKRFGLVVGNSDLRAINSVFRDNGAGSVAADTASRFECTRCSFLSQSSTGVLVQAGGLARIFDSAITSNGFAITLDGGALGLLSNTEVNGSIAVGGKSILLLERAVQRSNPTGQNEITEDSLLHATIDSTMMGPTLVDGFSSFLLDAGNKHSGDLTCARGSDAFCAGAGDLSGDAAGCKNCPGAL